MAQQPRHRGVTVFSMKLTSTVSVTLVLLLLGLAGMVGVSARNITDSLRSRVGFVAILSDSITQNETNALKQLLIRAPYVSSVKYRSADDILRQWQTMNPDEEDLTKLLGVNPFFAEFEVNVKPDYADPDSLSVIVAPLKKNPSIRQIKLHTTMVSSLNSTFRLVTTFLSLGAAIMLLIAFVLINNTIRLTIYSKRFTIRTMQLVGATNGFIRRPFLITNLLQGLVSAMLAIIILGGLTYYLVIKFPEITTSISVPEVGLIALLLIIIGISVCLFAAYFATNRYLSVDSDELYS